MKIYKYELDITDYQNIDVGGAMPTILSVKEQDGKLMMWVQLEEDYPGTFNLDIDIIGTGNPYEPRLQSEFVDTVIMTSGMEWHIFAKKNYVRKDD